jgi:hypothetical protein
MWLPGLECEAGGGQAAVDQVEAVLDLPQLALDDADQAVHVSGGEVRQLWRQVDVEVIPAPDPGARPAGGGWR